MEELERIQRIQTLASAIIQELVRDGLVYSSTDLRLAVENLSRSIVDLTSIHLDRQSNSEVILQGALSKTKLAFNTITQK